MVGQALIAVVVAARLMFVSDEDAVLVSLIVAFTGLVAVVAAQVLAGGVLRDVEHVRDGLTAVGEGRRDVEITTSGRDELAQLATAANDMIARLDEEERARDAAEGARRALVAAASHDLRTPITSLRLLADAVSDDLVDGDDARGVPAPDDDPHRRPERPDRRPLRAVAHRGRRHPLEHGAGPARRARRGDRRRHARPGRGARRSTSSPTCDGPLVAARANPEKLQRVLFNLIQNAIRHTPADGSVTVRGRTADGRVELEVADTGAGIADADRGQVFDTLFRGGEQAARGEDGAGLGLAISRAIVEAHGGRIWLADRAEGTCVRFSLPA